MNVTVVQDPPDWEPTVRRVVEAATVADGFAPLNEAAMLALAHQGLAGAHVYVDEGGFALVREGNLDLAVAPEARGRGLGTALLEAVLANAEAPLTAWSHGNHPAAASLAASHGFMAVRELMFMRRAGAPVEVTAPPGGVVIRPFEPGDETALLAANAAAFEHHPEQGSLSLEGLRERIAEAWFDPAGLFLAERDGEVVGFHWTKVHPDGTGEVYVVGVTPAAQGGGLGRALVTRGLDHLQPREVVLYVEADNDAGVALYRSLGFRRIASDVQYRRSGNG